MKGVWIAGDVIQSPLGESTEKNFEALASGQTGLTQVMRTDLGTGLLCVAQLSAPSMPGLSRFESLCHRTLASLKSMAPWPRRTLLILSTTKGNIELLDQRRADDPRIHLHTTAASLATAFGFERSFVISNACISGVLALTVGARLIRAGQYDHVVVLGADVLTHFVTSGFQSLQALSPEPCKPFDAARRGTNLGEGAAAVLLTAEKGEGMISIAGGGSSNDANHISGPSRTGEELALSIHQALRESNRSADELDFISAHGTATVYNDEMEAKAFNLAGVNQTPLHSLKGYFGHTLGAAGVIETIIAAHSLKCGTLIASHGYDTPGDYPTVRVIERKATGVFHAALKTASGFGGCNAAVVLERS